MYIYISLEGKRVFMFRERNELSQAAAFLGAGPPGEAQRNSDRFGQFLPLQTCCVAVVEDDLMHA